MSERRVLRLDIKKNGRKLDKNLSRNCWVWIKWEERRRKAKNHVVVRCLTRPKNPFGDLSLVLLLESVPRCRWNWFCTECTLWTVEDDEMRLEGVYWTRAVWKNLFSGHGTQSWYFLIQEYLYGNSAVVNTYHGRGDAENCVMRCVTVLWNAGSYAGQFKLRQTHSITCVKWAASTAYLRQLRSRSSRNLYSKVNPSWNKKWLLNKFKL